MVKQSQVHVTALLRVARWLLVSGVLSCAAHVRTTHDADAHARVRFPDAIVADTRRLEFHGAGRLAGVTLEEQASSAARAALAVSRGGRLVRLRAFAVGSENLERAQVIIGQALSAARSPLPAMSLIGVAGFPDEGRQLAVEITVERGDVVNPTGVIFLAGLAAPTGERTVAGLKRVLAAADAGPDALLRISCFYEASEQLAGVRAAIASEFKSASATFVHSYAHSGQPLIECEGVARSPRRPPDGVRILTNLPGATASQNYSLAATVGTSRVLFTSTAIAHNSSDAELSAMYMRLRDAIVGLGGQMNDVVMGDNYWMTSAGRDSLRNVRGRFLTGIPPAATGVFFAGLADSDAVAGADFIVALRDSSVASSGSR